MTSTIEQRGTGALPNPTPPEPQEKKRRGLSKRAIAALITGGLVLGGGGTAAVIATTPHSEVGAPYDDPNAEDAGEQAPDTSDNTDGGETVDNSAVDKIPVSVVEGDLFESYTPEQQAKIQSLEGITDLGEFRALSEADQFAFAWHVYEENLPIAEYRLKQQGFGELIEAAKKDGPEGASGKADLIWAVISSLKTASPSEGIGFDTLTAHKMMILITSLDPSDALAQQRVQGIDETIDTKLSVNTPLTWVSPFTGGVVAENGTFICNEGTDSQTTYMNTAFRAVTGRDITIPRQVLAVNSSDPRYIQNLAG